LNHDKLGTFYASVAILNVNDLNILIKRRQLACIPLLPPVLSLPQAWNVGIVSGTPIAILDHTDKDHTLGVTEKKAGRT
jgi:hypothetical protein